jgi:hypothetical protein
MKNILLTTPKTRRLACVWVPTGNARAPLACVWIDSEPSLAVSQEKLSSPEEAGKRVSVRRAATGTGRNPEKVSLLRGFGTQGYLTLRVPVSAAKNPNS